MIDLGIAMLAALGFKLGVGMVGMQIATWGDHDGAEVPSMVVSLLFAVGCLWALIAYWPSL